MKAALIGNGPHAETRAEAIRAAEGVSLAEHLPEATAAGVLQRREAALDVVFISGAAGRRVQVAEAALRQGRHVFLEWPPAASVQEGERLAERAEEAGAEVGASRPLRFHPLFGMLPGEDARAEVLSVQEPFRRPARWRAHLTDALDVCRVLGGGSVRRLDAQAARRGASSARLEAVVCGLRFHSGAYAQICLRQRPDAGSGNAGSGDVAKRCLYAAGPGFRLDADFNAPDVCFHRDGTAPEEATAEAITLEEARDGSFSRWLLRRETRAFLQALRAGRPAPVSILDALATLRLSERLMQQLR